MSDKTKIKAATDQELQQLINRLRNEREASYLITELRKNTDYEGFATNMDISIKDATDMELDMILRRLYKESEAQELIARIKRMSGSNIDYSNPAISTEQPVKSLYHYGIKGMRWGVRKSRSTKTDKQSDDYKKTKPLRKKKASELSNEELKALTTRLQLEKQFKDLNKKDIAKGQKFVTDILKEVGKEVAKTALKTTINEAMKKKK